MIANVFIVRKKGYSNDAIVNFIMVYSPLAWVFNSDDDIGVIEACIPFDCLHALKNQETEDLGISYIRVVNSYSEHIQVHPTDDAL